MAAGMLQKTRRLVDGSPTVVTKILPQKQGHDTTVIVVIPGNPGVIDFYDLFIESLFLASGSTVPVYGVEHAGHSLLEAPSCTNSENDVHSRSSTKRTKPCSTPLSLKEQVKHKLAFLEEFISPEAKLILIGHSIGSYIILKLLKHSKRSRDVVKAILLFPTIERMAVSPSGVYVTPIVNYFKWPVVILASMVSWLPTFPKKWLLQWWFSRRNVSERTLASVLKLVNGQSVNACLTMARDEMADVVDVDDEIIADNIDKLIFYYGATDHWTPLSYYRDMKEKFPHGEIYLCQRNFKHAFVLESSKEVADLTWSWIKQLLQQLKCSIAPTEELISEC